MVAFRLISYGRCVRNVVVSGQAALLYIVHKQPLVQPMNKRQVTMTGDCCLKVWNVGGSSRYGLPRFTMLRDQMSQGIDAHCADVAPNDFDTKSENAR